ncbi:hypothetical protein [Enterococcus gallinarum]|uniref:hypothetical protein n=1 Tax=Enterococcus gallinarum TaxID=1353 RepID=UPI00214AA137|nr:hypothetical protein [Enterococcus gallinarum]MCR1946004.1 hypothetical protein [Enterococcus gallinarum]
MNKQQKFLIFVIPVIEEGVSGIGIWLTSKVINKGVQSYLRFDWTEDIRQTIYFDTREQAEFIANKHRDHLQPHFCSVIKMNEEDINFLGINKAQIPEKFTILDD